MFVAVGTGVFVGVGVGVAVLVGVGVAVLVAVAVGVGVAVLVGVGVFVDVDVGVLVTVGVGVFVDVGTGVTVANGVSGRSPTRIVAVSLRDCVDEPFVTVSVYVTLLPLRTAVNPPATRSVATVRVVETPLTVNVRLRSLPDCR